MKGRLNNISKRNKITGILIGGLLAIFVFFPGWLAGDNPLVYRSDDGRIQWNIFQVNDLESSRIFAEEQVLVRPFIPFHPVRANLDEGRLLPPISRGESGKIHWLGTDHLGRDVLSGLIWGAGTSLSVGLGSVVVSFLIAVYLAGLAAYYGDKRWFASIWQLLGMCCILVFALFAVQWWYLGAKFAAMVLVFITIVIIAFVIKRPTKGFTVPMVTIVSGFVNVFDALPALIIAMVFFLTFGGIGIVNLSLLIGVLKVPSFYRIARAEIIRVREKPYVLSAILSRKSRSTIIWREIMPNISSPLLAHAVYSIASVIVIESTISFLNIGGVNSGYISWGKQLSLSRNYIGEWWLVVFPGLCIFITIIGLRYFASQAVRNNSSREY